jgi:hypothetical protein
LTPALGYILCALVLRGVLFGNPVVHIDEQFYLFVGDRMLQGALPYVDIWDRKPIGLFLIYAVARLLGGDGVLAYQLIATASAAATALVINRLARMIAPPAAAWWSGVAYLIYLLPFNCAGGQVPVFYNLPVALAALALVHISTRRANGALAWKGAGLMLLVGLAMQIKYSAVFEGMAFGLVLGARALLDGFRGRRLVGVGLLWIASALLATAAAYGYYVAIGHGAQFVQANFISIFYRNPPVLPAYTRLVREMAALTPFWLAILVAPRRLPRACGDKPEAYPILVIWLIAAIGGFIIFGTWYDHYVAPMLVPLSVMAAPALARSGKAKIYTRLLIGWGLIAGTFIVGKNLIGHGNAQETEQATTLIRQHLDGGCLYIFEGDPILYKTTQACLPTAYVFPTHLSNTVEVRSLGVVPSAEVRRIITRRPAVIMLGTTQVATPPNYETRRILVAALRKDYVRFAQVRIGTREYSLYQRVDLARHAALGAGGSHGQAPSGATGLVAAPGAVDVATSR